MNKRTLSASLTAAGVGLALALAAPLAASAHVSVTPNDSDTGTYSNFEFKALNESATATTTTLEIELPTDTPIVSVSYQPTPGWTTSVITEDLPEPVTVGENEITEAPTRIIFQADAGAGIAPGQFQQWTVSFGPLPDVGSLVLPAVQTYDDGEVANWTATAEEVEADSSLKPAPVIFINDEPNTGGHGHDSADTEETVTDDHGTESASAVTSSDGSGLAVGLSIAALVLAAIGAGLGAFAVFGRKTPRS
ncbi:YcnI family protein [Cryobacterium sp.]|jgi:uncharacterized protein YcnI|uniref:YcnI family copper-binding membrane protein n=1 Tax=Cryobacterium sp. TaxID=1926290 RepID=UPI00262AE85A|nr:YcnI family protein [Cryobacterium sp.]MCU1446466.1 hypothetical protein [Cryobacterium sp.]